MEIALRRTRNTIQRKAVEEAVHTLAGKHPTAAEVYAAVRESYPQLSLATVYRALHALVQQRAITEIRIENVARYDVGMTPEMAEADPHHHMVCRVCGAVTDIDASALPGEFLKALESTVQGCLLDPHPIQFRGVCVSCQNSPVGV